MDTKKMNLKRGVNTEQYTKEQIVDSIVDNLNLPPAISSSIWNSLYLILSVKQNSFNELEDAKYHLEHAIELIKINNQKQTQKMKQRF